MTDLRTVQRIQQLESEVGRLRRQENTSVREPAGAYSKYFNLLNYQLTGLRAYYPGYNTNFMPNGFFSMSTANTPSHQTGTFPNFSWVYYNSASPEYFYSNNSTDANLFTASGSAFLTPNFGLTVAIWAYVPTSHDADYNGLASCWNEQTSQRSWRLIKRNDTSAGGVAQAAGFDLSSDGSTVAKAIQLNDAIPTDKWVFIVGRYDPSTSINIRMYHDHQLQSEKTNTTSIPSALYTTGTLWNFIGNYRGSGGTNRGWNGYLALFSLSINVQTDAEVDSMFWTSKSIVGV